MARLISSRKQIAFEQLLVSPSRTLGVHSTRIFSDSCVNSASLRKGLLFAQSSGNKPRQSPGFAYRITSTTVRNEHKRRGLLEQSCNLPRNPYIDTSKALGICTVKQSDAYGVSTAIGLVRQAKPSARIDLCKSYLESSVADRELSVGAW